MVPGKRARRSRCDPPSRLSALISTSSHHLEAHVPLSALVDATHPTVNHSEVDSNGQNSDVHDDALQTLETQELPLADLHMEQQRPHSHKVLDYDHTLDKPFDKPPEETEIRTKHGPITEFPDQPVNGTPTASQNDDDSENDTNEESVDDVIDVYDDLYNPSMFEVFEENRQNEEDESNVLTKPQSSEHSGNNPHLLENISEEDSRLRIKARNVVDYIKHNLKRETFMGIISLYGKTRYTLDNYDHLVAMMKDKQQGVCLPSASSMRQHIFPYLVSNLFVHSTVKAFKFKKGYQLQPRSDESMKKSEKRKNEAVVVLPSSWAKIDVRTLTVLRNIICLETCRCLRTFGNTDLRMDSISHVTRRTEISKHGHTLWINKEGVPVPSLPGMSLKFHCVNTGEFQGEGLHYVKFTSSRYRGSECQSFIGNIEGYLTVHQSDSGTISLKESFLSTTTDGLFHSLYRSCLIYLRNLCKSSIPMADVQENGSNRRSRKRRRIQTSSINLQASYLLPSDHITILSFSEHDAVIGIFISRYWLDRLDNDSNFFIFLQGSDTGDPPISTSTYRTVGAPLFVKERNQCDDTRNSIDNTCRTKGKLSDGITYYVYRILLYADDFNARSALFPKGSVGGLYMSPTSLPMRSRRSQSSIRTVSLTPPGVSTNAVIDYMIHDLATGSIDGFTCIDAFGQTVRVFLDVMGFLGDYPASSSAVDVKGHTANAPCTHCSFKLNRNVGRSTYAFTTAVSSAHSSYRRTQDRATSIRAVRISKKHLKLLGLTDLARDEFGKKGNSPLLQFASVYNARLRQRPNSPEFTRQLKDGYALNIIAPDHLLTGLFKGVLTCLFIQMKDANDRDQLQILLMDSLREFGFQTQKCLFKKGKLVPGLTMSMLYALLTVIPSTLKALGLLESVPTKRMILNLHSFFSISFWWPTLHCDGANAWEFVHGNNMKSYHRLLQVLASNFVKCVDDFCISCPDCAAFVDRPNIHRLLELSVHTIPIYMHISLVCELVFEAAHQPLKFLISRNHTTKSHIYSVQLILAKDWLFRIWSLWSVHSSQSEQERYRLLALVGILRLIGGKEVDTIDWTTKLVSKELEELRDHVHDIISGTVEGRLRKWYDDALINYDGIATWELKELHKHDTLSPEQHCYLSSKLPEFAKLIGEDYSKVKLSITALLRRGYGSSTVSSHERIESGDIIQLLLEQQGLTKQFLDSSLSEHGHPVFFLVGGFFKTELGAGWLVLKRCSNSGNQYLSQLPESAGKSSAFIAVTTPPFSAIEQDSAVQFIRISQYIRKVGHIHDCSHKKNCTFSKSTNRVNHSCSTLDGGRFYILTRSTGYPPRRS